MIHVCEHCISRTPAGNFHDSRTSVLTFMYVTCSSRTLTLPHVREMTPYLYQLSLCFVETEAKTLTRFAPIDPLHSFHQSSSKSRPKYVPNLFLSFSNLIAAIKSNENLLKSAKIRPTETSTNSSNLCVFC